MLNKPLLEKVAIIKEFYQDYSNEDTHYELMNGGAINAMLEYIHFLLKTVGFLHFEHHVIVVGGRVFIDTPEERLCFDTIHDAEKYIEKIKKDILPTAPLPTHKD